MPPFGAQSIEAGPRHCLLQEFEIRSNHRIRPLIIKHGGGGEVIELGWHWNLSARRVHHCYIDRCTASVHGADALLWVRYIIVILDCRPKLLLHGLRSIIIPDLQAITMGFEVLLSEGQTLRDAKSNHPRHAWRVEWPVNRVVQSRIAQFDQDS